MSTTRRGRPPTTRRRTVTVSNFDESVGGGVGDLAAAMNGMRLAIAASSAGPSQTRLTAAGATDAAGNVLLDLGVVPAGTNYRVRQMSVAGSTWSTTATGTAIAFLAGSPPPTDTQPPTQTIRAYASSLPNVAYFDAGHFVGRHPEHIYVYIINGAASANVPYVGGATVDAMPANTVPSS